MVEVWMPNIIPVPKIAKRNKISVRAKPLFLIFKGFQINFLDHTPSSATMR